MIRSTVMTGVLVVGFLSRSGITAGRYPDAKCELLQATSCLQYAAQMAQNPPLKRYLDAGIQFSQMTQQRAEGIVKDLVKAGEVQSEKAQAFVGELVERSRKNSDKVVAQIRKEVRSQMALAEFVTKDVVNRLQAQIEELRAQLPGGKPVKTAAKTTAATASKATKKAPAKKAAAKKATAAKRAVKKAPAKRAAPKSTS